MPFPSGWGFSQYDPRNWAHQGKATNLAKHDFAKRDTLGNYSAVSNSLMSIHGSHTVTTVTIPILFGGVQDHLINTVHKWMERKGNMSTDDTYQLVSISCNKTKHQW